MRESLHAALIAWAQHAGEGSDYTDNLPLQCLHPTGHWSFWLGRYYHQICNIECSSIGIKSSYGMCYINTSSYYSLAGSIKGII